ncbi:MAG: hypothetical protein ABI720_11300, partial [Actinomycetes bacterium]
RRAVSQSDLVPLPAVPPVPPVPPVSPVPAGGDADGWVVRGVGRYLGATRSGDWLDRIVVHGLGVPSKAQVVVSDQGVWILRQGAADLFIASGDVVDVRHDRASAGRVLEAEGVLLITWSHNGTLIDIGLRVPEAAVAESLRVAIVQTSSITNQGEPA